MRRVPVAMLGVFALALGCAGSADEQCVSSGEAEVCAEVDAGGLGYTASRLEPGSTVTFSTPEIGSTDVRVSPRGGFDGTVGILSASGSFVGVVTVTAIAEGGDPFGGEFVFE